MNKTEYLNQYNLIKEITDKMLAAIDKLYLATAKFKVGEMITQNDKIIVVDHVKLDHNYQYLGYDVYVEYSGYSYNKNHTKLKSYYTFTDKNDIELVEQEKKYNDIAVKRLNDETVLFNYQNED